MLRISSGILATSALALHAAVTPVKAQESTKTMAFVQCQQNSTDQSLESELAGLVTAFNDALPDGHPMKGMVETFIHYPLPLNQRAALIRGLEKQVSNPQITNRIADILSLQRTEQNDVLRCLEASGALEAGVTYVNPELVASNDKEGKDVDGLFSAEPAPTTATPVQVTRSSDGETVVAMSDAYWQAGRWKDSGR